MDIQEGVHARACTGGSIALAQYDLHTISGKLPSGASRTAQVRVTQLQALVMLKLLALADRYSNIRGPKETRHDRDEAQTHAADIVGIVGIVGADADQLKVVVSSRIREEFENGRVYYHLHGRAIRLPRESNSLPAREYLAFYNGVFC